MHESWSGASGGSLASVISSGKAFGGGRRKLSPAAAEARLSGGRGRPHLRVHVVRRVTEEAAGSVLVQVHGLVDDGNAIVYVAHLVAHCRLVRREAPLIIDDKLILVRTCQGAVFVEAAGRARAQWQVIWDSVSPPLCRRFAWW